MDILEHELPERRGAKAQLVELLARAESGGPARNQERRDSTVVPFVPVCHGEYHDQVCFRSVRDESLGAVDREPSPSATARVLIANVSEPDPGSVIAWTPMSSPLQSLGR
jgi:hypothetical protein